VLIGLVPRGLSLYIPSSRERFLSRPTFQGLLDFSARTFQVLRCSGCSLAVGFAVVFDGITHGRGQCSLFH
jgi:hypothetical protein